jgi:hypothetical protein
MSIISGTSKGGIGYGHQIEHSLRFRSSASGYLSRTPGGAGNQRTWTLSAWVKRAELGTLQFLFAGGPINGTNDTGIYFGTDNKLNFFNRVSSVLKGYIITTAVFRDPAAWLNIVAVYDIDTGGASTERMRLYVNGTRLDVTTSTTPVAGTDSQWNDANVHYIGKDWAGSNYMPCYAADVCFIDGQALTPSSFGRLDANGNWNPINVSGLTYGTNGFHLDMYGDGTLSATTGVGADLSGNDNDFTPSGISVTTGATDDRMWDTPTNGNPTLDTGLGGELPGNYATLNPLDVVLGTQAPMVLTDGNLKATYSTGNTFSKGSMIISSGKWYWECTVTANATSGMLYVGVRVQSDSGLANLYMNNGTVYKNASTLGVVANTYTTNDVIGIAVDADAGTVDFYKNGSLEYALTGCTGLVGCNATTYIGTAGSVVYNFGQRPFASAAPTGFKALCTANLPAPAIENPADVFVSTLGSNTTIESNLAALRSGWTDYVDVFKCRGTSEQWYWRFSDDSSNALKCPTLAAKTAFPPTWGGTSYVAYSINCDGVFAKTGTTTTTTGTITHNLGVSARSLVMLCREDAASAHWYVYHPDGTSGDLLYMEGYAVEATDGTISNVTANAFDVSGLTAGTYRYLVIAESAGMFALGKHTGNAATNGPFDFAGLRTNMFFIKSLTGGGASWYVYDQERDTYNVAVARIVFDNATTEATTGAPAMDLLSNGIKYRNTDAGSNGSGVVYCYAAFAEAPFKTARAR